jgi:hypothetical protein
MTKTTTVMAVMVVFDRISSLCKMKFRGIQIKRGNQNELMWPKSDLYPGELS